MGYNEFEMNEIRDGQIEKCATIPEDWNDIWRYQSLGVSFASRKSRHLKSNIVHFMNSI